MTRLTKQIAKQNDGLGNNKKRQSAISDIETIKRAHNALAGATQKELDKVNQTLDDVSILLTALSNLIGPDAIKEEVKKVRIKLLEDEAEQYSKNVQKAVEDGKLHKVDTVSKASLVVTKMTNSNGEKMYPSENYLHFGLYQPNIQALLDTKAVGDVVDIPDNGGKIEILAIYEETKSNEPTTPAE